MPIRGNKIKIPQVDRDAILDKEFDELSDVEKRWLQDTDYWPADMDHERQPVTFRMPDGTEISNDPVWQMMQNQKADLESNPMLRRLIEEKARELVEQRQAEATGQFPGFGTETTPGQSLNTPERPGGRLKQGPSYADLIPENVAPEVDEDEEEDEDDDVVPYELMGIQELRHEAVTRDPKVSIAGDNGKKGNLIPLLEQWDAEHGGRPRPAE